jgi:outer membrane protein TolC
MEPATQLAAFNEPAPAPTNVLFNGPTPVETLVQYAAVNNSEIAAARANARAKMSRVQQVRSRDDPMLSTTVFLEEIQTAAGPQELMLSLSQKFPWFGKLDARGQIACHDAQVAFAELANVELAVIEQVRLAYLDLYFIARALETYQQLEDKFEEVLEDTRIRFETGDAKYGLETVYQAEVTLNQLQITVAELEQARANASARLTKALHLPARTTLNIEPELNRTELPGHVDTLVAMIESCHPQLRGRQHAVERDRWRIQLARRDYYPDVNLGFNWYAIGKHGISPVANGEDAFALMAGINLPIYKAKRDAALREARWKTSQSSHQYAATWDGLRAEVGQLHAKATEHKRVLKILDQDILQRARDSFDLSVAAFRVDRIGFQQLIDNYENLLRFRLDYYHRVTSYEQAVAQLERAVGCAVAQWPLETTGVPPQPLPRGGELDADTE